MKNIFIDRLKIARQNLSQQAAADKIGIKQQAYARYETGRSTPGMDVLRKMCVVFGVSADWLLGLSDTMSGSAAGSSINVTADRAAVAINGNANTVHGNCANCPLMRAATKVVQKKDV